VAITWEQIEARKKRLNEVAMGLGKEIVLLDEHDDPLLFVERQAYLKAIREALAGIETARVVLAKAAQRHTEAPPGLGGSAR
jgi:hypothetical protein